MVRTVRMVPEGRVTLRGGSGVEAAGAAISRGAGSLRSGRINSYRFFSCWEETDSEDVPHVSLGAGGGSTTIGSTVEAGRAVAGFVATADWFVAGEGRAGGAAGALACVVPVGAGFAAAAGAVTGFGSGAGSIVAGGISVGASVAAEGTGTLCATVAGIGSAGGAVLRSFIRFRARSPATKTNAARIPTCTYFIASTLLETSDVPARRRLPYPAER